MPNARNVVREGRKVAGGSQRNLVALRFVIGIVRIRTWVWILGLLIVGLTAVLVTRKHTLALSYGTVGVAALAALLAGFLAYQQNEERKPAELESPEGKRYSRCRVVLLASTTLGMVSPMAGFFYSEASQSASSAALALENERLRTEIHNLRSDLVFPADKLRLNGLSFRYDDSAEVRKSIASYEEHLAIGEAAMIAKHFRAGELLPDDPRFFDRVGERMGGLYLAHLKCPVGSLKVSLDNGASVVYYLSSDERPFAPEWSGGQYVLSYMPPAVEMADPDPRIVSLRDILRGQGHIGITLPEPCSRSLEEVVLHVGGDAENDVYLMHLHLKPKSLDDGFVTYESRLSDATPLPSDRRKRTKTSQ
jgi:hypothetical protein